MKSSSNLYQISSIFKIQHIAILYVKCIIMVFYVSGNSPGMWILTIFQGKKH